MTNWDFYKDSYQLAAKAYEVYCDGNMRRRAVLCDDSTMCEICHARWYTLEWRPEEYMEVMAKVADDWCVKDWTEIKFEPNAVSEKRLEYLRGEAVKKRVELANSYGFDTYEANMAAVQAKKTE